MEHELSESTVRLLVGTIEALQVMCAALETAGAIPHGVFAHAFEKRLEQHPGNDLEAAALAMMVRFFRPDEPSPPILRVIEGGKVRD